MDWKAIAWYLRQKVLRYTQVQTLDIPDDGLIVWLRDFGQVKLFRTHLKNQMRHYAIYLPIQNNTDDDNAGLNTFAKVHLKNYMANIGKLNSIIVLLNKYAILNAFKCVNETAVKNHIFAAICGYVKLQQMRATM